ncbi:phytanoyl-CoA dioxygenase domain-containing protein 1 homolog isoform X1 [Hylaeus volcanicus]|uniref:phytanoyl-CoA dioxygenase domain-containing protein 1 homolog isoform X1 n=1 Tax=Hylaeus volcanicus TaxID=313075 RepID=UPI0023B79462|nr:phytanoyl-CoA dioxygenase domain-containing protein 1 homolog isoform X1 [Hylaeus volcanicus]
MKLMLLAFEQFQKNGYVILEDFFKPEEVDEMRLCGEEYTKNLPPEDERSLFSAVELQQVSTDQDGDSELNHPPIQNNFIQTKDQYFLDSANVIRVFFEPKSLDANKKLLVDPRVCLSKVGHALHWLHPTFKKYSFDERIKEAAFQLDLQEPAICQSMYLYKNPGIGSEISMHQDATYLYTEPQNLVGFWIALDDATTENGCLWFAPGSHKSGVHRRYMRNKDPDSKDLLIYDSPPPCYQLSNFRPTPVPKGTLVLIHGQVVHFSYPNKSEKSRHAYTFHVIETKNVNYPKENWLQPPPGGFPKLYRN